MLRGDVTVDLDPSLDVQSQSGAWRLTVLNTLLIVAVVVAVPVSGQVVYEAIYHPEQLPVALAYLLLHLCGVALAVFRRSELRWRAWSFLLVGYLAGVLVLVRQGLTGDGRVVLLTLPFLAFVLLDLKAGLVLALLNLSTFVLLAVLAHLGWMAEWVVRLDNPTGTAEWVFGGASSLFTVVVLSAMQRRFDQFGWTKVEIGPQPYEESGRQQEFDRIEDLVEQRTAELIALNEQLQEEVAERRRTEEALRRREEQYELAQRAADIGVWDWDCQTGDLHWSDRVEPIFGMEPGTFGATYEAFLACVHPEDRSFVTDAVEGCIKRDESYAIEHRILWPDGTIRWVLELGDVVRDDQGQAVRMLGVVRDVTERKEASESLRQYATELEARNEDLNAFAHTVAHGLKDPLGIIVGFAEVLEESCQDIDIALLRQRLRTIARNGRKMGRIIDELLLLAGASQLEVKMHPLNMASIVAEAKQRLFDVIEEAESEIVMPDNWPVALGYGPWVEEVWINYISNAIKYGGHPPRVELGATVEPQGSVRFWVRDNGPGLDQDELNRLFAPFTRLDQTRAKGHGLGLSIVRRIVEKLDGHVSVESKVGQGSIFAFTLPGDGLRKERKS